MNFEVRPDVSMETSVEMYQKTDLDIVIKNFATRLYVLGVYADGPTKWMHEVNSATATGNQKRLDFLLNKYERQEQKLDIAVVPLVQQLIVQNSAKQIVIVGSGPGRRIKEYLHALDQTQGTLIGVDPNFLMLEFAKSWLEKQGELPLRAAENAAATERPANPARFKFYIGHAANLSDHFEEESVDHVHWERVGNHITNDEEFFFAARHQAVPTLRPNGCFILVESLNGKLGRKQLNSKRKMSPLSKFRSLDDYCEALGPAMRLETDLLRQTKFAGDDYVIAVFRKIANRS
jgi:hypothetical protein